MKLNTIKPADGARKERTRVGRGIGSGLGKTCGRGHKGQYARSGKVKAGFEGGQMPLQRRLPKVGFRSRMAIDNDEVMLYQLNALDAETIDLAVLREAGLVSSRAKFVKVVKRGDIERKIALKGINATAGAKAAIEAAGGSVE